MLLYALDLMVIFLVFSWLIALYWPTARRYLRACRRQQDLFAGDWFRVHPDSRARRERDEHETHAIGGSNYGGNPHGKHTPDAP